MKLTSSQREHVRETIAKRDRGHARLGVVIAAAALGVGWLGGWNMHENSDVRANYIAGLPSCVAEVEQ